MKFLKITLFLLPALFIFAPHAQAEGLLANSCVSLSEGSNMVSQQVNLVMVEDLAYVVQDEMMLAAAHSSVLGLSCKDIRAIDRTVYVVGVAIAPAMSSLAIPAVRTAFVAELATLGLVAGSPAVATATIIGGFGFATYKVLMKVSLEKCAELDREKLKNELFREFEQRYGLKSNSETSFQISR